MHAPKQPTNPIGTNQETKKGGPDLNKQRMVTEPKEGVPKLNSAPINANKRPQNPKNIVKLASISKVSPYLS
jgi:hypothetical protein